MPVSGIGVVRRNGCTWSLGTFKTKLFRSSKKS